MARRWRAPDAVIGGTLLLGAAATAAVAASGPSRAEALAAREVREALLGGAGLGRAVDLSRCPAAFDPRLGTACRLRHGPVPGSDPLCPDHLLDREIGTR